MQCLTPPLEGGVPLDDWCVEGDGGWKEVEGGGRRRGYGERRV